MENGNLKLEVLREIYAVCQLASGDEIPGWATKGPFFSISRTADELSLVCEQSSVPSGVKAEKDWNAIKVKGPLDFGLTGILASLANPLAKAEVSLFAISTFDTDYLLIKCNSLKKAISVLTKAGFQFNS